MKENKHIENKVGLFIGSGVIAGILASVCCIGPLVLTILGVSGAAILSKFDVLRLPFMILVFALFGVAGILLYKKRNTCEIGSICADPKKFKTMVYAYWIGLVIAVIGLMSPYILAKFF